MSGSALILQKLRESAMKQNGANLLSPKSPLSMTAPFVAAPVMQACQGATAAQAQTAAENRQREEAIARRNKEAGEAAQEVRWRAAYEREREARERFNRQVSRFLNYVVEGERDKAEALLNARFNIAERYRYRCVAA